MSYEAKFKGKFEYKTVESAMKALEVIDEEDKNPNDSERNGLGRDDFQLQGDKPVLTLDFKGFIPASMWYGCKRVICKMSKDAIKGKVKCGFEGDPDEWVRAGQGYD